MNLHDEIAAAAERAVEAVGADTSVPIEKTIATLQTMSAQVRVLIDTAKREAEIGNPPRE